ncbi:hypothetical protein B5D77_05275 [Microcystis sp. MC19]|nr:hypothetical protein B5D77_05275 [Microcystis sp. MC19]
MLRPYFFSKPEIVSAEAQQQTRFVIPPLSRGLSLIGIFLNNFCSKHSNPYPDLISVFSLSVRVSTRNITNC